jgi:hypothetical protein
MMRSAEERTMKKAAAITCLFLDIGGVLLTDGWDHHARKRAALNFRLDLAEMEDRHHLTFDTYEEGKLTLEEYLGRVVFYQKRPFTRAQFRRFMFAQSKPAGIEDRRVQQRSTGIECSSDPLVQARTLCGFFYFLLLHPCPQAQRGHFSVCAGRRPDPSPAGGLYRKQPHVRPDRGRFRDSKHSSHGLQVHVRAAGFVRIAE